MTPSVSVPLLSLYPLATLAFSVWWAWHRAKYMMVVMFVLGAIQVVTIASALR